MLPLRWARAWDDRGKCNDGGSGAWVQPSRLSEGDSRRLAGDSSGGHGRDRGVTPAAADPLPAMPPHGAELRGMDLATQSPTTEGRFGFMFKNQPPHAASEDLLDRPGSGHGGTARHRHPLTDPFTGEPVMTGRQSRSSPTRTTTTPSARTPTRAHVGVHLRRPVRRPRHHLRHHDPRPSSSPTPTPPPTSARPATTSTPSTGWAPAKTRSSTTPPTGTSS